MADKLTTYDSIVDVGTFEDFAQFDILLEAWRGSRWAKTVRRRNMINALCIWSFSVLYRKNAQSDQWHMLTVIEIDQIKEAVKRIEGE